MIIGVVYTMSVGSITRVSEKSFNLNLTNLKGYLSSFQHTENVKILCLDDCSECDIYVDGEKKETLENFLDKNVVVYRYESLYGYTEKQKEVFFNEDGIEQDVCFSYEIDKSGVGDQILIEFEDKFYDYATFFTGIAQYTTMEEATSAKEDLVEEVMQ